MFLEVILVRLFSYGSLQRHDVQIATFGRLLDGVADELVGYVSTLTPIADPERAAALGKTDHANVSFTGNPADSVSGVAFEVTEAELEIADEYERQDSYVRVAAKLKSGSDTWVYVHEDC